MFAHDAHLCGTPQQRSALGHAYKWHCLIQGKGLAAKLESQLPEQRKSARHPQLLQKLATALMEPNWDAQKDELLFHAYACPWLQALLKACAGEPYVPLNPHASGILYAVLAQFRPASYDEGLVFV